MKYKVDSPAYEQYGPYGLVDLSTRTVVATNLDAEAIERELFEPDPDNLPVIPGVAGR